MCTIFIYGGANAALFAYGQAHDQTISHRTITWRHVVRYRSAAFFLMRAPGREPGRIKIPQVRLEVSPVSCQRRIAHFLDKGIESLGCKPGIAQCRGPAWLDCPTTVMPLSKPTLHRRTPVCARNALGGTYDIARLLCAQIEFGGETIRVFGANASGFGPLCQIGPARTYQSQTCIAHNGGGRNDPFRDHFLCGGNGVQGP